MNVNFDGQPSIKKAKFFDDTCEDNREQHSEFEKVDDSCLNKNVKTKRELPEKIESTENDDDNDDDDDNNNDANHDHDEEEEERGGNLSSKDDEDDCSFSFPPNEDVTDMLDGVHYNGLFPTITDRYFTPYYKLNVQKSADDICILMHSNRICMLTLAPSHALFQTSEEITKVNFKVSEKLDRILNKVSGKSKHGAQPLQANSNICIISTSNGNNYTIKCCIIGKLVEVNEALLENPKLLLEPPHKGGYLAIVLPNLKLLDKMKESLLTKEQYEISIKNDLAKIDNNPPLSLA